LVSSYTPNLNLNEPATGDLVGAWGPVLNANFTSIDARFGSITTVALSNSNVTLSQSQINNYMILLTGTLTGNVTISFPAAIGGTWVVYDKTSGSFTVTINTVSAGTSLTTLQGYPGIIASDGSNIFYPDITNIFAILASNLPQYISSNVLIGSAIALSTGNPANVTSISLTPGYWDVQGAICYTAPSDTNLDYGLVWVSTTSNTFPTMPNSGGSTSYIWADSNLVDPSVSVCTGLLRLSVSTTTTVYLSTSANFNTDSLSAFGFLSARQVI